MEENKFLKILWLCGFIAFAAVSCWATADSLQLLQPDWPAILCWIVTVGFFVVASIGSKLIVDSLNQNIYMEKRGLSLIGGTILLLVFWLVCSMPTNTHTFFYRSVIDDKLNNDLTTTIGYLQQIKDNKVTEESIQKKQSEVRNNVEIRLGELKAEIMNDANPGFGPKAKEILKSFAELLGVAKIDPLTYQGTSKQAREKLNDAYRQKIYILMETRLNEIRTSMLAPNQLTYTKEAAVRIENLKAIVKNLEQGEGLSVYDPQDMQEICKKLNEGYTTIRQYQNYVTFNSVEDEENYLSPTGVTKVKRLMSVFDVWQDYLSGEYNGYGFIFWIIISILVDIAAFIFFDLAFKRTEY